MTQRSSVTGGRTGHLPARAEAEIIAGRYRTLGELGGGGMAVVYQVVDVASGGHLALKRPRASDSAGHERRTAELFAREFQTLTQLAHPRIVAVYDYGVDERGPYYTMELLDGGDLQNLTPVDYRRACAIASDVCSALSLLHSRRIVHRDVSPRNIRCTADGLAKLIDFGAMTYMGPSKELVGTPVYCAPETLQMQTLDARTDLYALGASLYYALTQRHAYPARDFASLANAWRFGVARPSELMPGIPDALDALILDLLQLQPDARPSNAAEVMTRLSAIAGTPLDEHLLVAQAYLAKPAFVGRKAQLKRVETKTMHALSKRGAALLIDAPAGAGRSRFLDEALLTSKLLGMTVVRADASDGERNYGVVRRMLCQLWQIQPQLVRELSEPVLPLLGHVVPELIAGREVSLATPADLTTLRPKLQAMLVQLFLEIADRIPLLLAIDDVHAIDEASTATTGLLAQQLGYVPLVIVVTAETMTRATPAFKLFADEASKISFGNLTQQDAESLLASVFGDSHELAGLSQRMHTISGGRPRDLLRLAQHLVDTGSARYHAGTWSWPLGLDNIELPSSVAQVLSERLRSLPAAALELARALALCPEKSFSLDECAQLSDRAQQGALLADIDQLVQTELLRALADRVVLSDRAWLRLLHRDIEPARLHALHLRLAQVFAARPNETFRHAQHLLRAGETDAALDHFVADAIASRVVTDKHFEAFHQLLSLLPADWFETYEQVLQLLQQRQRPTRDSLAILMRLSGVAAVAGLGQPRVLDLMTLLERASGLQDWAQLDATLAPGVRLQSALAQAQARYLASSEHERVADPATAIRELASSVRMAISICALTMDLKTALSLPSLQPLLPVAPALAVAEQLVRGVQARLSGRIEHAQEIYRALLERLSAAEGSGLDTTHRTYTRLMVINGVAVLDAASGLSGCLAAADELATSPSLESNAWLVRMMHHLWQGNVQKADHCRKQFEKARVQSSAGQTFETVPLPWQLIAYVAMEDLTRIKQTLAELTLLAAAYPAFRVLLHYGEAEYQRIRGDSAAALKSLAEVLPSCEAGSHQIWPQLAAAHVRALDDADQSVQAVTQGRLYITAATRAELGASALYWISLALCVAEAKSGELAAAYTAETLIEQCLATGAVGLKLGLAYEARARVAVLQSDAASCERYQTLCAQALEKAGNPALSAKLRKLKRHAQRRLLASDAPMLPLSEHSMAASVKTRLRASHDRATRARDMLSILAEHSGAREGYLYVMHDEVPVWVASQGLNEPEQSLCTMVQQYVLAELHADAQSTGATEHALPADWTASAEGGYRPVLLSHYARTGHTITGVALLVVPLDRPFVHPGQVAAQISQVAQEVGDVTGLLVDDSKTR